MTKSTGVGRGRKDWAQRRGSGIPAGGPGLGVGRGGPAQGFRPQWSEQPPGWRKSIGKMEAKEYREAVKARLADKLAVYDRATEPDQPIMAQLKALEMMENRAFGQAKQVIEQQDDTRTDDEIRADIERRRRELEG